MKKKQTKHFVLNKNLKAPDGATGSKGGIPACQGFKKNRPVWGDWGEIAKTRRGVTCGRCRRTRVFRKLK